MGALPDFPGIGKLSIRKSAWMGYFTMIFITAAIISAATTLQELNNKAVVDVLIYKMLSDWFEVIPWTIWFVTVMWGWIALVLPARPRAPKRAALLFLLILLIGHIIGHSIWIVMFLKRCHAFFLNSLAGNVVRDGVETFFQKTSQKSYVQDMLYVLTPVANWVSAPFVFNFYHRVPPLDVLFWCGWNWVLISFFLGIIPLACLLAFIPVLLAYINAIDHGGNGTERCAPSKIELFYSLEYLDRQSVRAGIANVEDFMFEDETSSSGEYSAEGSNAEDGRGGTRSSSIRSYASSVSSESSSKRDNVPPKRIPSYKPQRFKHATIV